MTKSTNSVDESQQLTAANLAVVKAFLKHSEIKPDFNAIADEIGIKGKHNAPRDLKKALQKWGLTWKNGIVCSLDNDDDEAVPATPAKVSKETNGAGKKRKGSDQKDESAKEVKKTKVEEDGVDDQVDAQDDDSKENVADE